MITCVHIDDEKSSREILRDLLYKYVDDIEIIGEGGSVEEGLQVIREKTPDLLLLDVEMQDGTGFDLLKALNWRDVNVIFITAFNDYAVKAFRAAAIDYLLKPVDVSELKSAILRVKEKINSLPPAPNTGPLGEAPNRIAVPDLEGISYIKVDDIVYLQADRNYTHIHMREGQTHLTSQTLKEYEDILMKDSFIRIHHSYIINLDYLQRYVRGEGGSVFLETGVSLDVSRRKKNIFLETLKRLGFK